MEILFGLVIVLMLAGAIFYNKLRTAVYGVIGVGGSYLVLIAIMMLFLVIGSLFGGAIGNSAELFMGIIFMFAGLGYLAFVMIKRCTSAKQRILLPIFAVMIALGFCWRFLFKLLFGLSMSNGAPAASAKFPSALVDDQGETWNLCSDSGDHAEYQCRKTGARTTIWHTGDYLNVPHGWRAQ